MLIRSDVGAQRTRLSWLEHDLMLVHPANPADPRPFIATLHITDDGLSLTTDRTKNLKLHRK